MPKSLNGKNILITVAGPDHPGITSELFKIIARGNNKVLDMGQSVTHGLLSLSLVIKVDENNSEDDHVIKDLLFSAYKMGLNLTYKIVEDSKAVKVEELDNFILNCVAVDNINASFIHDIAEILADQNINIKRIDRVSPIEFNSLEVTATVPRTNNLKDVKEKLLKTSNDHQVDVAFLKDNIFRRSKRLIVFDMDSTLIQAEVIDELAEAHGVGAEIKAVTEAAMNGEIDFDQSLKQRVSKLKGLKTEVLKQVLDTLPLTPGVHEFIKTIKSLGYKVAVISGGFTYFAEALKEQLGLDYAFANELDVKDGVLTGEIVGSVVNAEQKATLLKLIAQQESISLEQVVAIGDGANDLPMLATAGLGIAFHAKDIVKEKAEQHMSHGPMTSILYFLGIPGPESEK